MSIKKIFMSPFPCQPCHQRPAESEFSKVLYKQHTLDEHSTDIYFPFRNLVRVSNLKTSNLSINLRLISHQLVTAMFK